MTCMDYTRAKDHILAESHFNPHFSGKCEAVMSQGNGYLELRAATEENYHQTNRGLFVAGTFDRFDEVEVSELPKAADCTRMELELNGHRFSLSRGNVTDYTRQLDLRTGLLSRDMMWESVDGCVYHLSFQRFVSLKRLHFYAQRVSVTLVSSPDSKPVSMRVVSGIDGQMTNSGTQHFSDGTKRYYDKKYLQLTQTTVESKITFLHNACHVLSGGNWSRSVQMPRRSIQETLTTNLNTGQTVTVEKLCNVYTTRDLASPGREELPVYSLNALKETEIAGFDALFAESQKTWNEQVWNAAPVQIDSTNPIDQLAMDFAQYHLLVMVPRHDNRMNIGAKGLSGEGYKGHCFWDTEIFLLPYFSFTDPAAARKLMEYRYHALPAARIKARDNGFVGAMYPWESAWIEDGDVTPAFAGANVVTGEPTKVWSGIIEQHITADVAYGVWQYFLATGDQDFMDRYGYEIILDTARFWSSRLEWSEEDKQYHINDVIGADEYKEHCNDNSLTNYLAKWNMEKALEYCEQLQTQNPALYAQLSQALELEHYIPLWRERAPLIFLNRPRPDGVIGQDRDYLSYPVIDMTPYKQQTQVDSILKDYNQTQLSHLQVTKQADLLILLFMLDDLFSTDVKRANWHYYEEKTTHDSSLSYCTHCILASDIEEPELAYDFFCKSLAIDMGENMGSSDMGIHAASIGGIWQCVIMGFGGVRLTEAWKKLKFTLRYQGETLQVNVTPTETTVKNITANKHLFVLCQGKKIVS